MGNRSGRLETAKNKLYDSDNKLTEVTNIIANIITESRNALACDVSFIPKGTANDIVTYLNTNPKSLLASLVKTLNIPVSTETTREYLCDALMNYIQKRLELLQLVYNSLGTCSMYLNKMLNGPNCEGYPDAFTVEECTQIGGIWNQLPTIPDPSAPENDVWYGFIDTTQDAYDNFLGVIFDILERLTNPVNMLSGEQLSGLAGKVQSTINEIQDTCSNAYYESYNMIEDQKHQARIAILRESNGLPTSFPQ